MTIPLVGKKSKRTAVQFYFNIQIRIKTVIEGIHKTAQYCL